MQTLWCSVSVTPLLDRYHPFRSTYPFHGKLLSEALRGKGRGQPEYQVALSGGIYEVQEY
jgi:hypothetical protein